MISILKKRARKFLAAGKPQLGMYPSGVGGMDKKHILSISVGEYSIFISEVELKALLEGWAKLDPEFKNRMQESDRGPSGTS